MSTGFPVRNLFWGVLMKAGPNKSALFGFGTSAAIYAALYRIFHRSLVQLEECMYTRGCGQDGFSAATGGRTSTRECMELRRRPWSPKNYCTPRRGVETSRVHLPVDLYM